MQSVTVQLFILLVLIGLSAWFSSAETAFSTVSRVRLKTLADKGDRRASSALLVLSQYSKMLSAILIMNNVVNLSASALMTSFIIEAFGASAVSIGTAVLTTLIILFGEITPKNLSTIRAESIVLKDARTVRAMMVVLTPIIVVIDFLSGQILKLLRVDRNEKKPLTESELRTYVEVGQEDGAIENREKKIIYNVFDFGDSVAHDIMVPRIDMACVSDTASLEDVMNLFRREMFTRIPVYSGDPDHIIGHLNVKDFILLTDPSRFSMKSMIRESYFTYEYKKTADLLKEMQQKGFGVAFVLNEYGSTVGMITLEDLVEEIVGDIRDEYDADETTQVRRYDELTYLVDGAMKLDDLNDQIGSRFASDDYDSIGGLIIEQLERLPANGESVTLEDGTQLQVKGIRKNRIVKVLIRFRKAPDSPEEEETAVTGERPEAAGSSRGQDAVRVSQPAGHDSADSETPVYPGQAHTGDRPAGKGPAAGKS